MLIGSFTPLAKVFVPRFQKKLVANPDLIFDDGSLCSDWADGYDIKVYKPSGDYLLKWRYPKEEQNAALIEWLTGGPEGNWSPETDIYGIVQIPMGIQEQGELYALIEEEISGKKIDRKSFRNRMKTAIMEAHARSEARVMKAIETTFSNLKKQYAANRENNFGLYEPSQSEFLCVHVVRKAQEKQETGDLEIASKMESIMEEIAANENLKI